MGGDDLVERGLVVAVLPGRLATRGGLVLLFAGTGHVFAAGPLPVLPAGSCLVLALIAIDLTH